MRTALLLASLPFAVPLAAQAPPGYRPYENKAAAIAFYYPLGFRELPLPPTEQTVVARFVVKERPRELKRLDDRSYKAAEPQLFAFTFELQAPTTGPAGDSSSPSTVREAMEAGSRVGSWEEFVRRFRAFELTEEKDGAWSLRFKGQWSGDGRPVGYLARKQEGSRVLGVYGIAPEPYQKVIATHVQKMAHAMRLADGDAGEAAAAAIDKLYRNGRYRAVEWRKRVRLELAKDWRALDTDNFLIVHHSSNERLIHRIARDVEAMRELYAQRFPAVNQADSVSVVRVCRTKEEYGQYGGPPGTGGYWHPGNEELVFYDYSYTMQQLDSQQRQALGRKLDDDDSLLVLYHEAFHQYIHYAIGEFQPHDWFNEGYGDYFSGAVVANNTGRVLRVEPSSWRIHRAKDMFEFGDGKLTLKHILEAERSEFYNPARRSF